MNKKIFLLILPLSIALCTGCGDDEKDQSDNCPEGRTGSLKLVANMIHHTRPIKGCTVYVKYGATEFPGDDPARYDYSVQAANDTSIAIIDSLNCGDYYIYAVGVDSLLDPVNWICKGGIPFRTSLKNDTTINLNVFITEGD